MKTALLWFFLVSAAGFAAPDPCHLALAMLGRPNSPNSTPQAFTQRNPSGGFLVEGAKVYFAAPSDEAAKPVLRDLGLPDAAAKSVKDLPGWAVYEVTSSAVLSPRSKELHGVYSVYDGVRCYSACFIATGFANGAINSSPREFVLWAKSPLAKEVTGSAPEAGDVIAVGERTDRFPVSHVATYLTPNVVFQKRSPMAEDPFELVTAKTFAAEYPVSRDPNQALFRPVESLDAYVARHRASLPKDLLEMLDGIREVETSMEQHLLTRRGEPGSPQGLTEEQQDAWANTFSAAIKRVSARAAAWEKVAEEKRKQWEKKPDDAPEKFLWNFVFLRAGSLQGYPDPFD